MKLFKKKTKRKRAIVVGLDGVPFTLLKNMSNKNYIPNITKITDTGYFGQMNVSIPEISSVSWSSFMTGTQAGKHGIYGFIDIEPNSYQLYFPNYVDLKENTIWDNLKEHNKKAIVLNMPATYPARKINGALISGFVAVDLEQAVYPLNILKPLKEMLYKIDIDLVRARGDHKFLFEDLKGTLKTREAAVNLLWKEIDWDLFIIVITGTDRLMHYLLNAYYDDRHEYHTEFIEYFKSVDSFIGRIYDRFYEKNKDKDNNTFYMLSDHGFTLIESEVYLNRWLEKSEYLKFNTTQPKSIMDIGEGSMAFAMDPSRIYINLKDKYPLGRVENKNYDKVVANLKEGFEKLSFEGNKKVIKNVFVKEELFKGPFLDKAPDIVLLSNHGFDLKGIVGKEKIFGKTDLNGMHTQDDAFFFANNGANCDNIFDIKNHIINDII